MFTTGFKWSTDLLVLQLPRRLLTDPLVVLALVVKVKTKTNTVLLALESHLVAAPRKRDDVWCLLKNMLGTSAAGLFPG